MVEVRLYTSRVLEPDRASCRHIMHFHAEPIVVHHAHEIPVWQFWLAVLRVVPCADSELSALPEAAHRHIQMPMDPAVGQAILTGPLKASDGCRHPRVPVIERHLHPMYRPACAVVRIATNAEGALRKLDLLAVCGCPDCRVDVPVVNRVGGIGPDFVLGGLVLGDDVLGKDPIVIDVVMVRAFLCCHCDRGEPLDHSPTNVPWHKEADGIAMVRVQQLAVHHEGQHTWARRVHACLAGVRRAVSRVTLRNLALGAREVQPVCALLLRLHADVLHEGPQRHARPDASGRGRTAPIEANALLDDVLLLSPVPSALQCDWHCDGRQLHELCH
mmetsp:Transcript_109629/g.305559  ORF Transcript_109629/g.305559 Transcript_109629/m.305559 type:complete len:330 (-) Transcript_109629:476-1465(-)